MPPQKQPNNPKRSKPQGHSPTEVRAEITALYQNADNGSALANALKKHHYTLVRSTRHILFVIDPQGGEHNLLSRINAPREDIQTKLADLDPATLPLKKSREREAIIKCFVSPTEKADIQTRADQAELSVSGYLRRLIFGKNIPQPKASRRPSIDKSELFAIRYQLRQIGGQLSQLANAQNQNPGFDNKAFSKLCSEHEKTLKAIMTALRKQ